MSIFRIISYNYIEVFYSFFMFFDHLICFGTLMDVPNVVCLVEFDAPGERIYGFFKFLDITIGEANVIIYIAFVFNLGLVKLSFSCGLSSAILVSDLTKRFLKGGYTTLEVFISVA